MGVRLEKTAQAGLELIYSRMGQSFPQCEMRDYKDFLSVFNNPAFAAYDVADGDKKVGVITLWRFEDFTFIEHLAIFPEYRGCGYGGEAVKKALDKSVITVLEIELPETVMQKRRLKFYERLGFKVNGCKYFQPPYRAGDKKCDMLLLSYPAPLENARRAIEKLHKTVYGVKDIF